jgi:hypothetical protein
MLENSISVAMNLCLFNTIILFIMYIQRGQYWIEGSKSIVLFEKSFSLKDISHIWYYIFPLCIYLKAIMMSKITSASFLCMQIFKVCILHADMLTVHQSAGLGLKLFFFNEITTYLFTSKSNIFTT